MLRDLPRPLSLEVVPSATYTRNEERVSPSAFGDPENDPEIGVSVKYGVTSTATVEATANPDFSQVESDAFQVEVNQRYPVFYAEKRPFFMEGMGTFELAGVGGDAVMRTAVHTRKIVDPAWGGKAALRARDGRGADFPVAGLRGTDAGGPVRLLRHRGPVRRPVVEALARGDR